MRTLATRFALALLFLPLHAHAAQVWEVADNLAPGPSFSEVAHARGFGGTLVSADFDGDGDDDLAVAAPYADSPGRSPDSSVYSAGMVRIFWGAPGRTLTQAISLRGTNGFDDLGSALAAGDFDGDGRPELAIGGDSANVNGLGGGKVWIERYAAGSWQRVATLDQDTPGVPGMTEPSDSFGAALTVGDFDHDHFDDLAVGIPYEDWG
ncbi:MAG TPA: FG-GAP repeat protein [Thermoanaerobaculia bacterium]|jgi:hypothetical protein|nr:FG-GAP repeat protein [Thermoanaerobaculia bacterium]